MFLNYFAQPHRPTALNLAVARVILGGCALWKVVSLDWSELAEWPRFLFELHPHRYFLLGPSHLSMVPWLEVALVITLLCFVAGYRTVLAGFLSAGLIAHILSLQFVLTNHRTLLLVAQLLLLYALFSSDDEYSVDNFRRKTREPQRPATHSPDAPRPMRFLKWALVTIALGYFFTGYGKIVHGPILDWVSSDNLGRIIQMAALRHLDGIPPMGVFVMANPWLGAFSGWATVLLEAGFIWAVLLRQPVWPVMIGLFGMHTVILLTHGLLFFELYLLFLMFLPWDGAYSVMRARLGVVGDGTRAATDR